MRFHRVVRWRSAAVRTLLVIAFSLSAGCFGPKLLRTEGDRLEARAPWGAGDWIFFVGEGHERDAASAVRLAEQDARRQAAESVRVEITSDVERRIQLSRLRGVVTLDEAAGAEIRSRCQGAIEGSRRSAPPYLEFYSDGTVRARVEMAIPRRALDPAAIFESMLRRQAMEHLLDGRLEKARNAYFALSQHRPADPIPYLHLARIAEQLGDKPAALQYYTKARDLNGGERWLEVPDGPSGRKERIDLLVEIDRVTPHWENLLAQISRLEEARKDRASFRIEALSPRFSRSQGAGLSFRLSSVGVRSVALVWIDEEGLYFLMPPEGFAVIAGPFFRLEGLHLVTQDPGTVNGRARLLAVSASPEGARAAQLADIARHPLDARDPRASAAEDALRRFLEKEAAAGSLEIAATSFEIVP